MATNAKSHGRPPKGVAMRLVHFVTSPSKTIIQCYVYNIIFKLHILPVGLLATHDYDANMDNMI